MTAFTINIPEDLLSDLATRLSLTRFPDQLEGVGSDYGLSSDKLRTLVDYWANDFDWRAQETALNAFNHYETARDQSGWGTPNIPVGYLMPKNDMFPTPRSWIERQEPIVHWTETESGGHFMEWEEPQIVADDLRKFFTTVQELS
ncbi:MAG: epoxide hydrolase family protein [Pseudomonadota bacterium]